MFYINEIILNFFFENACMMCLLTLTEGQYAQQGTDCFLR